jgi:hypothetical protein
MRAVIVGLLFVVAAVSALTSAPSTPLFLWSGKQ